MRCADALGKALRGKLANIMSELGEFTLDEIKSDDGLKSNIIGDPLFSVEIISNDSFIVAAAPRDICRSLLRDYYFGYLRVKNQWQNASLLAEQKSIAWALVSAYYCSFFGAIEALRICGTPLLSLSRGEANEIFSHIGGPHANKILEKSNFKGSISSDFSKIGYTVNGDKPHQAAWQQLQNTVLPIVSKNSSSWVDIAKFKNMCNGSNGWETPSDIRNRWNYRDPLFFSQIGSDSGSPFLKLLEDSVAASSWIRRQVSIRNEKDSAASIASLTQLLQGAMEDTYQYGFLNSKFLAQ